MNNKVLIAIFLVVILLVVSFFYSRYRIAPSVNFPTLKLTDLNNKPVSLNDFKGKKIFVNFFATWCGPCVRELPSLEAAQGTLQNDNFVFVCISDEPVERLQSFAAHINTKLLILHSTKNMHDHNIYTIPTSYVINAKGQIVFNKVGERDWNDDASIAELKKLTE